MSNTVTCPYCGHENDTTDMLHGLDSTNNTDWECFECEEEFSVYVEFDPVFYPSKIEYIICPICGVETRDFSRKEGKDICITCYVEAILKEIKREGLLLTE